MSEFEGFIERPRYTCAFAGAIAAVTALPQGVPILHAPSGCAGNFAWTQAGGSGLQVGGYCGGLSMPGSNVQERDVVFGGAERLEEEIKNALQVMEGGIFVVLTSCVTEVIGDDIAAVVRPFKEEGVPIIFAETGGFKGNSYRGYDLVLQSLLRDFAEPAKKRGGRKAKRKVNVWGIAPSLDPFWRGNLEEIRSLLEKLGLEVNSFFTEKDTLAGIRKAGDADLNIVLSEVYGREAAELSKEIHGIPYITVPLPIGPSATNHFLRTVTQALSLDEAKAETVIEQENQSFYRWLEPSTDCFNDIDMQRYVAVIGEANYAAGLTRFLSDDVGWLPEVVAVTDLLTEEQEESLAAKIVALESGIKPQVIFATDSSDIHHRVKEHWAARAQGGKYVNALNPAFVVGSSLDRDLAKDLGAGHLSISFPVANRAVIDRSYTGYRGGLHLIEDVISVIVNGR